MLNSLKVDLGKMLDAVENWHQGPRGRPRGGAGCLVAPSVGKSRSTSGFGRHPGSGLFVALILSAIVLSIGMTAVRLVLKQVVFTADLVQSERAYFAAESGVETALLKLSESPLQHWETTRSLGASEFDLHIENQVLDFEVLLPPRANTKFRLGRDLNIDATLSDDDPVNFDLRVNPDDAFQWSILCREGGGTLSIQGQGSVDVVDLFNKNAVDSSQAGIFETFNTLVVSDKSKCFFSLTNVSDQVLDFYFDARGLTMTPDRAHITSIGRSGNREKHIQFDYRQANIGSLFDFTFFHRDGGL